MTALSPGVMGPYGFVPFMECNHGILSLDHALESGRLAVDVRLASLEGDRTRFEGRGHHACLEARGDLHRILDG